MAPRAQLQRRRRRGKPVGGGILEACPHRRAGLTTLLDLARPAASTCHTLPVESYAAWGNESAAGSTRVPTSRAAAAPRHPAARPLPGLPPGCQAGPHCPPSPPRGCRRGAAAAWGPGAAAGSPRPQGEGAPPCLPVALRPSAIKTPAARRSAPRGAHRPAAQRSLRQGTPAAKIVQITDAELPRTQRRPAGWAGGGMLGSRPHAPQKRPGLTGLPPQLNWPEHPASLFQSSFPNLLAPDDQGLHARPAHTGWQELPLPPAAPTQLQPVPPSQQGGSPRQTFTGCNQMVSEPGKLKSTLLRFDTKGPAGSAGAWSLPAAPVRRVLARMGAVPCSLGWFPRSHRRQEALHRHIDVAPGSNQRSDVGLAIVETHVLFHVRKRVGDAVVDQSGTGGASWEASPPAPPG